MVYNLFESSTLLQNRPFYIVDRTRMVGKCIKVRKEKRLVQSVRNYLFLLGNKICDVLVVAVFA